MTEEVLTGVHMMPDHEAERKKNQTVMVGCLFGLICGIVIGALCVGTLWGFLG